ncbi:hypothetical protein JQC91_12060 [Jannaschia sp. Os4]|uniref:hypothetical protein n=1 Tax=Jannaschia sp. Os4 TaxID=2807617 RepID=UPI00193A32EC|nr:hypothetical protein [Jannaschia sp. Os4]MBM2577033.1 hypothetical protein [Jannaschia sp. Os4]
MGRAHLYIMSLIAVVWGLVVMAEYVLVAYGLRIGWLADYPPAQIEWLTTLPGWAHGAFGVWATLALVGALCLAARVAAAAWMLGIAAIAQGALTVWALLLAAPPVQTLTDGPVTAIALLTLALSLLLWAYARGERRRAEGVL